MQLKLVARAMLVTWGNFSNQQQNIMTFHKKPKQNLNRYSTVKKKDNFCCRYFIASQ